MSTLGPHDEATIGFALREPLTASGASSAEVDGVALPCLDPMCGGLEEMMGKIRERPSGGHVCADRRQIGVSGISPGTAPSAHVVRPPAQDSVSD
jgi:hypothetical protein